MLMTWLSRGCNVGSRHGFETMGFPRRRDDTIDGITARLVMPPGFRRALPTDRTAASDESLTKAAATQTQFASCVMGLRLI